MNKSKNIVDVRLHLSKLQLYGYFLTDVGQSSVCFISPARELRESLFKKDLKTK